MVRIYSNPLPLKFKYLDPLSAVDQHVQRQLFSSIVNVLRGKTRVLITHQLSLLNQVDRVMVLDNGNVTAIGTFEGKNKFTHCY